MEQINVRTLVADEIDCRVGQAGFTQKTGTYWCTLLLYKNARVDMALLDELFGPYGWQREHKELKGVMYCGVSVRDPKTGEWVAKWDAGAESNTEAEKGEASDSFKRACVNWGIGRELYSGPSIFIDLNSDEYTTQGDKVKTKNNVKFFVKEIEYSSDRKITDITIVDRSGKERFSWSATKKSAKKASAQKAQAATGAPAQPEEAQQSQGETKTTKRGLNPNVNYQARVEPTGTSMTPQQKVYYFLKENPDSFQWFHNNGYGHIGEVDQFSNIELTRIYEQIKSGERFNGWLKSKQSAA